MTDRPKATAADLELARKRIGPIERREMRLAFVMLAPTVAAVLLVVLVPVLANFWISVKPIELADLRAAKPLVRERVSGDVTAVGDTFAIEYRVRSSSPSEPVKNASLVDEVPEGLQITEIDSPCAASDQVISCEFGTLEPKKQLKIKGVLTATQQWFDNGSIPPKDSKPVIEGRGKNALLSLDFTFDNFRR